MWGQMQQNVGRQGLPVLVAAAAVVGCAGRVVLLMRLGPCSSSSSSSGSCRGVEGTQQCIMTMLMLLLML
jgi:hypothetical protein